MVVPRCGEDREVQTALLAPPTTPRHCRPTRTTSSSPRAARGRCGERILLPFAGSWSQQTASSSVLLDSRQLSASVVQLSRSRRSRWARCGSSDGPAGVSRDDWRGPARGSARDSASGRWIMALRLTMGFSDNPRVQPLKDGIVKPQGIELDCITLDPSNLFQRNLTYDEFDVSEMSISEMLLARERTDGTKWDWSALPVFLSRGHHWHTLYVNAASGIKSLADIRGKRIGVPDYDMTAALWFRITLKDLHGIEAKDNIWYNGRTKALSHGGALGLHDEGPVGVTHHWLTVDQTLDVMLDRGEID